MKRMHALIVTVFGIVLSACAGVPVTDNYYSLVLAANHTSEPIASILVQPRVTVGPVELPSYLAQRAMVMQSGSNQIRAANHHFWAEPLDEAIAKVLVRDISRLSGGVVVERDFSRRAGSANCRLRFVFDSFHATSQSNVVASGRYWLTSSEPIVAKEFKLTRGLTEDGYSHAVTILRGVLLELAESVAETLQGNSNCQ